MPYSSIVKVERIQSKHIWRNFVLDLDHLKEKYKAVMPAKPTLMLYHGTRETHPDEIIKGEEGFDMRYSADGMWGRAVYFAVNSSYSHNYAHQDRFSRTPERTYQMFVAKVNVGLYSDHGNNSNSKIKTPPAIESYVMDTYKIPATDQKLLYDSIKGFTNGSEVYMVYANRKAYPSYLITYKQ